MIAVTFESELLLQDWLDSTTCDTLTRGGAERGLHRVSSDLVSVDGAVLPSGVGIVSSSDGMGGTSRPRMSG